MKIGVGCISDNAFSIYDGFSVIWECHNREGMTVCIRIVWVHLSHTHHLFISYNSGSHGSWGIINRMDRYRDNDCALLLVLTIIILSNDNRKCVATMKITCGIVGDKTTIVDLSRAMSWRGHNREGMLICIRIIRINQSRTGRVFINHNRFSTRIWSFIIIDSITKRFYITPYQSDN